MPTLPLSHVWRIQINKSPFFRHFGQSSCTGFPFVKWITSDECRTRIQFSTAQFYFVILEKIYLCAKTDGGNRASYLHQIWILLNIITEVCMVRIRVKCLRWRGVSEMSLLQSLHAQLRSCTSIWWLAAGFFPLTVWNKYPPHIQRSEITQNFPAPVSPTPVTPAVNLSRWTTFQWGTTTALSSWGFVFPATRANRQKRTRTQLLNLKCRRERTTWIKWWTHSHTYATLAGPDEHVRQT